MASPRLPATPANDLDRIGGLALTHYSQKNYVEAAADFMQGAQLARSLGETKRVHRFLNGAAGALLSLGQYRKALEVYEEARTLAQAAHDAEMIAVIELNVAGIYLVFGDVDAAAQEVNQAATLLPARSVYRASLYSRQARLALRTGDTAGAMRAIAQGLDLADELGNADEHAALAEDLGLLLMNQGDYTGAENALLSAYRIRRLHRLREIEPALCALARVSLLKGDATSSVKLAQLAAASRATSPSSTAPWLSAFTLGQSLAAAGRARDALTAYAEALELAREWRQNVIPSREIGLLTSIGVHQVANAYATLAATLAARDNDAALRWRALAALEDTRSAALRAQSAQTLASNADYRETLIEWRTLQFNRLAHGSVAAPRVAELERKLRSIEARTGPDVLADVSLQREGEARVRAALRGDEALLSFCLGEDDEHAWLWTVTRNGVTQRDLGSARVLRTALRAFREAIASGDVARSAESSDRLWPLLLSAVPDDVLHCSRWLVSADDAMLEAPLAALSRVEQGRRRYLVEDRTLVSVASAAAVLHRAQPALNQQLLAVADPIYNRADARFHAAADALPATDAGFELPRLPGSRAEVDRVASKLTAGGWTADVLTGADATAERFSAAMTERPGVVHIASHLVEEDAQTRGFTLMRSRSALGGTVTVKRPAEMFLLFSLRPDGSADGLTASTVGEFRLPGSLVVMSGCGTGLGTHQPGAGLAGFFRSWIGAGASSVVGTLWSIPDDASGFFDVFYDRFQQGADPPAALRQAQLTLLGRGGWQGQPAFWGAWTTVGRHYDGYRK